MLLIKIDENYVEINYDQRTCTNVMEIWLSESEYDKGRLIYVGIWSMYSVIGEDCNNIR